MDQLRATLQESSAGLGHERLISATVETTSLLVSLAMCNPATMRHKICTSMADGSGAKQHSPEESLRVLVCTADLFHVPDKNLGCLGCVMHWGASGYI